MSDSINEKLRLEYVGGIESAAAQTFLRLARPYTAEANRSAVAMAIELRKGVLDPVIEALSSNERPPGFCNWPIPFMLC